MNWTVKGALPVKESVEKDPIGRGIGVVVGVGVAAGVGAAVGKAVGAGEGVGVAVGAPTANAASGGRAADTCGGMGVGVRLSPIPNSQATLARSTKTRLHAHLLMLFILALPSLG